MAEVEIAAGFRSDRKFITLTVDGDLYSFPTADVPAIVEALRLVARGEWTPQCDPRVLREGDELLIAEQATAVRRGRSVAIDGRRILVFHVSSAPRIANMLEEVHRLLTAKLN